MSRYNWKNIQNVGLCIVAFEGTEHLVNIISELRDVVDYVSIGLQRKSYHGDPIDQVDLQEIFRLKDEDHLVDNIVEIDLDITKAPREQETDKRNILIQDAEDHGCSHAIVIDSDEFYQKNSFLKALKEIDDNNYEITYCQYINYFHDYEHFMLYPFQDGMYVPFVTKVNYRFNFNGEDFSLPSDPTRRYVRPFDGYKEVKDKEGKIHKIKLYTVGYHVFPWEVVKMHHFSWIRANIRKKTNDWSSKTLFKNYNDLIDKAVDTYNNFDVETTEQQDVHILFNTPNNAVHVKKLPKQYIYPKYDINTRLRPAKNERKILVLNLSSTNSKIDLFNNLDDACRKTWAKNIINGKYKNIDYYTVIDSTEDSRIDEEKRIIYVKINPNEDNLFNLVERFPSAYKLLTNAGKTYDYILRTNTSTWCNIDILNEFVSYEDDDSLIYTYRFMSAFWSIFNIYLSGACLLFSRRNMEIMTNLLDNADKQMKLTALDDVVMSALWWFRNKSLKLNDVYQHYKSFEGVSVKELYENTDKDSIDIRCPIMQIKTFFVDEETRLEHDIKKMYMLDEMWDNYKKEHNSDNYLKDILDEYVYKNMNKTIYVIPEIKSEWFETPDDIKGHKQFDMPMPYNKETLDYLDERAKAGGYKK